MVLLWRGWRGGRGPILINFGQVLKKARVSGQMVVQYSVVWRTLEMATSVGLLVLYKS